MESSQVYGADLHIIAGMGKFAAKHKPKRAGICKDWIKPEAPCWFLLGGQKLIDLESFEPKHPEPVSEGQS
jgi:hypothetical protein